MLPKLGAFMYKKSLTLPSKSETIYCGLYAIVTSVSTSPLVGSSTPASILANVVFPIPFEPNAVTISSWKISPASAVNLNPP